MWKSFANFRVAGGCVAVSALLLISTGTETAHAAADVPDYALSPVPGTQTAQKSGAVSKFKYMFGAPARWPGVMRWRYNHANAPAQFSNAKTAVIQQLVAESAKWTAICGVQIAYDGETTAVPKTLAAGGPDGISVIGWQKPDMGISGATYAWYESNGCQRPDARRRRHDARSGVGDDNRGVVANGESRMGARARPRPFEPRAHADVRSARLDVHELHRRRARRRAWLPLPLWPARGTGGRQCVLAAGDHRFRHGRAWGSRRARARSR